MIVPFESPARTACALSKSPWQPRVLICIRSPAAFVSMPAEARGRLEESMAQVTAPPIFKSPLHEMTQVTPTCLWNDSASIQELSYSIEHGAAGATCNPVIVLGVLKKEINVWKGRIQSLIREHPTATEDEIAWQLVREISA